MTLRSHTTRGETGKSRKDEELRIGNREQSSTSIQLTFMERKTVIDLRKAVMEVALPLTEPAIQIEFTL